MDSGTWQLLLAIFFAGSMLGVYSFFRYRKAESQRKISEENFRQLESQINSLRLESLEAKLNPHLLKNILNSIQSHAYQTYFALDKLANVLDYILYDSRNKFATPREEIEFALNLIDINKVKVSPLFELKVKTRLNETEPMFDQPLIAPLISIDLIENAFKHADLQSPGAFISVVFEFRDGVFYLTVSNKISARSPLKKERSGIGTTTLEERLKIIYKKNYQLERFVEGDVHIAQLKINLLEYKAEMLAVG